MGKSRMQKLEDRVAWLGKLMVLALGLVALTGLMVLIDRINENVVETEAYMIAEHVSGPDVLLSEAAPTEPVTDALAIASLKDYAGLEAERMAKMAAALMGLGGRYTAECAAEHKPETNSAIMTYSITWYRQPNWGEEAKDKADLGISKTWSGASWSECIQKMLAWKQGGE